MDTVDVDDLDCAAGVADDEVDSDAGVRPDVEDRELAKEQAIRDQFGVSATRYYQMLNALLDNPAALAHDAVLVKRLRRLRATRARARTGGRTS